MTSLDIIHEEHDFLVINKPAGLLVHPTETSTEPTLTDALIAHDPALAEVGDPGRPGLVHRLDRDTSGIMVIPRTPEMYTLLKDAFANREVKKEYLALVSGKLPKDVGEITFSIGRSRRSGRMAVRGADEEGRAAKTAYEVLRRWPHQTLVRVMPETGRMHQIRAHFLALGHPIVGDSVYRTRWQKKREIQRDPKRPKKIQRLMLHAQKISFTDRTGTQRSFETPLPDAFQKFLN